MRSLCFKILPFSPHDTLPFLMFSAPSIASLKKAMQTYARQGGTSNIFINDDGLRVIFFNTLDDTHSGSN